MLNKLLIPSILFFLVACGGIVLSAIGIYFVCHGFKVENHYRDMAGEIENLAIPSEMRIVLSRTSKGYAGGSGIRTAMILTLLVFCIIYVSVIFIY